MSPPHGTQNPLQGINSATEQSVTSSTAPAPPQAEESQCQSNR